LKQFVLLHKIADERGEEKQDLHLEVIDGSKLLGLEDVFAFNDVDVLVELGAHEVDLVFGNGSEIRPLGMCYQVVEDFGCVGCIYFQLFVKHAYGVLDEIEFKVFTAAWVVLVDF